MYTGGAAIAAPLPVPVLIRPPRHRLVRNHAQPRATTLVDPNKGGRENSFLKFDPARSLRSGSHYMPPRASEYGLSVGKQRPHTFLTEMFLPPTRPPHALNPTEGDPDRPRPRPRPSVLHTSHMRHLGGGWRRRWGGCWTLDFSEGPTDPPGGGPWTLGLSESPTDPLGGGGWTLDFTKERIQEDGGGGTK